MTQMDSITKLQSKVSGGARGVGGESMSGPLGRQGELGHVEEALVEHIVAGPLEVLDELGLAAAWLEED